MLEKTEKLAGSRVKLTIKVTNAQFDQAFEQEVERVAEKVKIQGFRPGKAPKDRVIQEVGRPAIEAGALDQVVSDHYYQAVREAGVVPLHAPQVDISKYQAPLSGSDAETEAVLFTAEMDVLPDVTITGYTKIKAKPAEPVKVEDDEVKRTFDYLQRQQAKTEDAPEDAVVKTGDWVDIGYKGSLNGVAREDMKNEHHPLVIGEGQLIPGFEDELIGLKKGEEKTFGITFPKDYHAKELAGKKAEFTATVHEIKHIILPPVDDEFAKQFGHDTAEALTAAIKDNLKEEKEAAEKEKVEAQVLEELLKVSKFELPQTLLTQEEGRLHKETEERLQRMHITWDIYFQQTGSSKEQIDKELHEQAEKNVRIGLALGKVIQEENITDKEHASQLAVARLVEIATSGK